MKDERFSGLLITRNLDKRKRDSYNDVLRFLLNFFGEGNKESESDGAQRNVPTLISAMTSQGAHSQINTEYTFNRKLLSGISQYEYASQELFKYNLNWKVPVKMQYFYWLKLLVICLLACCLIRTKKWIKKQCIYSIYLHFYTSNLLLVRILIATVSISCQITVFTFQVIAIASYRKCWIGLNGWRTKTK